MKYEWKFFGSIALVSAAIGVILWTVFDLAAGAYMIPFVLTAFMAMFIDLKGACILASIALVFVAYMNYGAGLHWMVWASEGVMFACVAMREHYLENS